MALPFPVGRNSLQGMAVRIHKRFTFRTIKDSIALHILRCLSWYLCAEVSLEPTPGNQIARSLKKKKKVTVQRNKIIPSFFLPTELNKFTL